MPGSADKSQHKVESLDSGVLKITLPSDKGQTDVDVQPGTSEHSVLIENREVKPMPDDTPPSPPIPPTERRQPQAPVHLQVQNQPATTPGLPGPWGIIAQFGAVGLVFVMCLAMWNAIQETRKETRSDARERDALFREEMRAAREVSDRRDSTFITAMNSLHGKFDQTNNNMLAVANEFRVSKAALEMKLDRILAALKAKIEEMGVVFVPWMFWLWGGS